jgi:hypothetical protein
VVTRRRVPRRIGEVYVALCSALAALAIFPAEPNANAYYVLVLLTLPVGIYAAMISYIGGVLLFGPDQDGFVPRAVIFCVWVGLITAQMLFARALLHARRGTAS